MLQVSPANATSSTFDRAYHQARAGSIVTVLPGRYPPQRLTAGGRRVIFAGRGRVLVERVSVEGARNVEFRDLEIDSWSASAGGNLTFRRVRTREKFMILAPVSNVSIIGGSVGPSYNTNSFIAVPNEDAEQPSRNILIEGVRFRGVSADPGKHVECLHLAQGDGVTIRDSVFVHCKVFALFITWWYFWPRIGPPTNVTIERNTFGPVEGFYSMLWSNYAEQAHRRWSNFVVRDNVCRKEGASFPPPRGRTNFSIGRNTGC